MCVYIYVCVHACHISMYIFRYRYVSVGATDSAGLIHCCRQGSLTHTSTRAKSTPYVSQRHLFAKTSDFSVLLSPTATVFLLPQHHIFRILLEVMQLQISSLLIICSLFTPHTHLSKHFDYKSFMIKTFSLLEMREIERKIQRGSGMPVVQY